MYLALYTLKFSWGAEDPREPPPSNEAATSGLIIYFLGIICPKMTLLHLHPQKNTSCIYMYVRVYAYLLYTWTIIRITLQIWIEMAPFLYCNLNQDYTS